MARSILALTHGRVEQSELTAELFSETDVAIALHRGHRLTRKSRITLESLKGEQLVLLRQELACGFYDPFFAACAAANVNLPVFQYTNDFVTKLWLVSAGFGISPTMLPSSLHFAISDVVYRPLAIRLAEIEALSCSPQGKSVSSAANFRGSRKTSTRDQRLIEMAGLGSAERGVRGLKSAGRLPCGFARRVFANQNFRFLNGRNAMKSA